MDHVLGDPEIQAIEIAHTPRHAIQVIPRAARAVGKEISTMLGKVDEEQPLAHGGRNRIVAMDNRPVLRWGIRLEPVGALNLVAISGKAPLLGIEPCLGEVDLKRPGGELPRVRTHLHGR